MIIPRWIIRFMLILPISAATVAATVTEGESQGHSFEVEQLASNLGTVWGMDFINEQQMLLTERQGRVLKLDLGSGTVIEIVGGPNVLAKGQGGLLDIKAAPDFWQSGWIYFTYSKPVDDEGATTLARAKLMENRLTDWQDLLVTKSISDASRHYGSRIAFDQQGHLYFTIGDRGHRPNGQDLTTHAGTIVRLNLDGSIPADNPFIDNAEALPEIWSYGHRNPQGISFDPDTGRLWAIEHGPRGGDEINLIAAGNNYGWPVVSQGKEYWGPLDVGDRENHPGMEAAVKVYIPSIAPGSLVVYRGDAFPNWQGNLFSGALKLTHLNQVVLDEHGQPVAEERLLSDLGERLRALITGPKGYLYLSTDSGRILQLRPKGSP